MSQPHPSINIEDGLKALDWFMDKYMKHCPPDTKQFILMLARWVLENNYVEFEGAIYRQVIGTAMGTISHVC